jgi:hypothetical protein
MAFMNQDKKAALAPAIKAALKKYGVKGSLSVDNYSSLVLTIKSGPIDFIQNYNQTVGQQPGGFRNGSPVEKYISVNKFWFHEHFSGKAKKFLSEVIAAMNVGNHNNSDASIDYFDVGWYINVNIGKWNKPYILEK